jgi:hypothetical protein
LKGQLALATCHGQCNGWLVANVKGAAVLARVEFIKGRFGEAGYRAVLERLTPNERELLSKPVLPQVWLPVGLLINLIDAAEAVHGKGDTSVCDAMARYAAEANLSTLYRVFYKITSASYVLAKAKALWTLHYDSGRLELEETAPKRRTLSIVGFDQPHCTHCRSVFGWAVRSIEMSGERQVEFSVQQCRRRNDATCAAHLSSR